MLKILHTADLHLGRSYQKQSPQVAERYIAARLQALKNAVSIANQEGCSFLVIAGDLYDKTAGIPVSLHKEVSAALEAFTGDVLILPGNHDYYNPDSDALWAKFEEHSPTNTRVFKENRRYTIGDVDFYPCICHDKHSAENALGWLESEQLNPAHYHIGIAHGAIEGLSMDEGQRYYLMTQQELLSKGMDAWLIGHTHVPFPKVLDNTVEQRIFNPGTPQQTDISDGSTGEVFVIEIDDNKRVTASTRKTGVIQFVKREVNVSLGQSLADALNFPDLPPENTSLRVTLTGIASTEDYENRYKIRDDLCERYIDADVSYDGLRKEITPEMIDRETVKGSLVNELLNLYADDMELLDLAYDLMLACKEGK